MPGVTFLTGDLDEAVTIARAAAGKKNLEILGADLASQYLEPLSNTQSGPVMLLRLRVRK